MNGIDAVCIATGNDWRAVEAGAHAYAAKDGRYQALTDWHVDKNGDLYGEITLPMAIGIVGDAGVRANAQQDRIFVGMILILIFAEALGLYGLIIALILSQ